MAAPFGDKVYEGFVRAELERVMALVAESDILRVEPIGVDGPVPRVFIARYACDGLVQGDDGQVQRAEGFDVAIHLPPDYLRRADVREVLTYLGPHRRPWHPNIRPPFICVRVWPGMPLVDLLYTCYELWTWRLYATGDEGLNHAASQWARRQDASRFPIDPRPLKRRELRLEVREAQKGD